MIAHPKPYNGSPPHWRGYRRSSICGVGLLLFFLLLANLSLHAQHVHVDQVKINIGSGTYLTTGGNIQLQNSGALDNSGTITLEGDWINNSSGLINASTGAVEFNGSTSQSLSGSNTTSFYDLRINN